MASQSLSGETRSLYNNTPRSGATSPRIEHFDGEVPPALSPLDAFAAQGRLLAKELEDSARGNRRTSRLDPSTVARSLSQPRPGYFRSQSSGDSSRGGRGADLSRRPTVKNYEVEEPKFRPQSQHPRLSAVSYLASEDSYSRDENSTPRNESEFLRSELGPFDVVRSESPEEDMSLRDIPIPEAPPRFYAASPVNTFPPGVNFSGPPRNSSTDSPSRLQIQRSLAPPASPLPRSSSSPGSMQPESSDDDYSSSNAGSTFSKPRKLSSSSAMSLPYSPMSSDSRRHPRSPSLSSETSNNGGHLPRPSFNFSRPLSRSSTSLSAPVRLFPSEQAHANQQSIHRGNKPGPIVVPSLSDLVNQPNEEPSSVVTSYTYTKYPLPRDRAMSRDSVIFSGLQTPHFEWQEPLFESPPPPGTSRSARTPSPPPSHQGSVYSRSVHEAQISERKPLTQEAFPPVHLDPLPLAPGTPEQLSAEQQVTGTRIPGSMVPKSEDKEDTTSSTDSTFTVRPQTARTAKTASSSAELSAEEHVEIGIELHQLDDKESLKKSTFHFRQAARKNYPDGILFYALCFLHSWGMSDDPRTRDDRQKQGVEWLRKLLNFVDDSSNADARTGGMYQLGMCYLNGWGLKKDESVALHHFEMAGQRGDENALAQAGFCYKNGVGCKKDKEKSAEYYRQAVEKGGETIVGNNWIYKAKYMNGGESHSQSRDRGRGRQSTPEKSARSKSRTRSIFQRKKALATEA